MLTFLIFASCTPSPEILKQLAALELKEAQQAPTQKSMEALAKEYEALAAGGDVLAMQEHIQFVSTRLGSQLAKLSYPEANDSPHAFAHAVFLRETEGEDAYLAALEALHTRDPQFAPALYSLVRRKKKDAKLESEYLALCPNSLRELELEADRHGSAAAVKKLRGLASTESVERFPYRSLWAAEFKTKEDKAAVKARVKKDIARIEAAPLSTTTANLLTDAYKLVDVRPGDPPLVNLEARVTAALPFSWMADYFIYQALGHEPPLPEDASLDDRRKRLVTSADRTKLVVEHWPTHASAWQVRFSVLAQDPAAADAAVDAAEHVLSFARAYPDGERGDFGSPPLQARVAQFYLARGVHLSDVPRLLDQAEKEYTEDLSEQKTLPKEFKDDVEKANAQTLRTMQRLRTEYALQKKDTLAAKNALAVLSSITGKRDPYEDGLDHCLNGRVLALSGAPADAFAELQKATSGLAKPKSLGDEEMRTKCAEALAAEWKQLGGSTKSLVLFQPASQPVVVDEEEAWRGADKPMAKFKLADLSGKTWTEKALQGKTTYIAMWASWCGPCRAELPYVEKLRAATEGTHMQVLTFNMDDNPGDIPSALEKMKFRVPVILAHDFVEDFYPITAYPTAWIVDAKGKIVAERTGFVGRTTWVDDVTAKLKSVATTAGAEKLRQEKSAGEKSTANAAAKPPG